ncbi:hypothetical protein [Streptomyces sp. NPDC015350]|uniref:hypothetical protein n=1 Tax=Streptomyces sp. NPDC015350 TaxID=3364955 RepID=UPI0036F94E8B
MVGFVRQYAATDNTRPSNDSFHGPRRILRLAKHWPWAGETTDALQRLAALADPG